MESSTSTTSTYRQQEEHSPQWISPIAGETIPARVDPAIYDLSESDHSQTRVPGGPKTNVSDVIDELKVTPTKDESTETPIGVIRKMSKEVSMSPILILRFE